MAAMGKFVQQGREKLCLIRPKGDALALETLFVSADVYSQAEIEEAVDDTTLKKPELDLAQQVIASLAGDFDPADLQSDYRRDLRTLLEAKLAGEEITAPEPAADETPEIDLMEALRRSVADAQEARRPSRPAMGKRAARRRKPHRRPQRAASPQRVRDSWRYLMRLGHRAQRLELRLEEGLVDLALVDRYAFLDAHANDFLPVDSELLRELFGRQVVRHRSVLLVARQ